MKPVLLLFLLAPAAVAGCGNAGTGSPPFTPSVGYGGFEPMGVSPDPAVDSARISIEEAMAVDCEGARWAMLRRVTVDFATGEVTSGEVVDIPRGTYCGLELAVAACADPDLCPTVAPDAIAIDGSRRVDAADVIIRDVDPTDVGLVGEPFELGPEERGVLLALDLNTLVASLAITTALIDAGDGAVHIDAGRNAGRLLDLRDGLRNALSLRRDLDGDGVLGPEELMAAPLAAPEAPPAP